MPKARKVADSATDDFKTRLRDMGNDSNVENEVVKMLEDIYIGSRNQPARRKAEPVGNKLKDKAVDDAPIPAVNPTVNDEDFDSDKAEEKFFVDTKSDGSDSAVVKDLVKRKELLNNPYNAATQKEQARKQLAATKARVSNAKNLGELMLKKGLVARQDVPNVVKSIAKMDNKSFILLKDIIASVQGAGRTVTAAAKTGRNSLDTPIHLAKPSPKGKSLVDSFQEIAWSGVPSADYDHSQYINS